MERKTKIITATAVIAVASFATASAVTASALPGISDDSSDTPITGAELERASTAALTHTGGGWVTETEVRDKDSYYEVEVTLDNGNQVDVQLDQQFTVVQTIDDHDEAPGSTDQ